MDAELYLKGLQANADFLKFVRLSKAKADPNEVQEALYRYQVSQFDYQQALMGKMRCEEHPGETLVAKHFQGTPGKVYCCNQGHCFKSPHSLGGHNTKTGHKKTYEFQMGENGKYRLNSGGADGKVPKFSFWDKEAWKWVDLETEIDDQNEDFDEGASAPLPEEQGSPQPPTVSQEVPPVAEDPDGVPGAFKFEGAAINWILLNAAENIRDLDYMDLEQLNGLTAGLSKMRQLYPNMPRFKTVAVQKNVGYVAAVAHDPATKEAHLFVSENYTKGGSYEAMVRRNEIYQKYRNDYSGQMVLRKLNDLRYEIETYSKELDKHIVSGNQTKQREWWGKLKEREELLEKYLSLAEAIESGKIIKVARPFAGKTFEECVVHEYGHFAHLNTQHWNYGNYSYSFGQDKLGGKPDAYGMIRRSALSPEMIVQAAGVSDYAMTNGEELFAESWVLFHKGRLDLIPPKVLEVIQDVDSFHRTGKFVHMPNERPVRRFD